MKTITPEEAERLIHDGDAQTHEQRTQAANERLQDLVRYAKEHSRYFQKAYADLKEPYKLTDLPVTTKAGLMEDYEAWVTDPEITLKGIREYLSDAGNVKQSYLGRYTALTTSGTTGEPMPMVRDSYRNVIHGTLMNLRLLRGLDPKLADPYYTKASSVIATGGFVSSYSSAMRNKQRLGDRADNYQILSLLLPTEELVEKLNAHDPKFLTGYPSNLMVLAQEKAEGRLKITPELIGSSAEKLSLEMYESLREAFGCTVVNNYCSTEGGEIAMSCPHGYLHLNDDWILLEPVDENNQPAKPGELSAGVLMTDLTNYVQPIIRYHVGDCIQISYEPCKCGSNLPIIEISGRMGDTLTIGGKSLTFPMFYFWFDKVAQLLKWQVIQTGTLKLEVRFSGEKGSNRAVIGSAISEMLKNMMHEYGCGDVGIVISDEDFIKTKGGKVPYVIKNRG